jgi:Mg2+ and Co2+ transporter CorA
MSTTPSTVATTSLALVLDSLTPVLEEIGRRANRVSSSLHVLKDLDNEYSVLQGVLLQQGYIGIIQRHMQRMKTDLETIKSIAEFLDNGSLRAWVDNVDNKDERNKRMYVAESLTDNLKNTEKEMEKARNNFSNAVCVREN